MTLGDFLNACQNNDVLFSISDGTDAIATLTGNSAGALSTVVSGYTVTSFSVVSKTSITVVVSTS